LQNGYSYQLTELPGKNFAHDFKPELTPKEMLELGVFGGLYLADCQKEFPQDWFKQAKLTYADVTVEANHDASKNFFGVNASQPLAVWQKKGWIHPQDPRGWFQWYCRYYIGRRSDDDERQIKRWKAIKRHKAAIQKNCQKGNLTCRPKQRQSLLHWAIDARKI
jgi:hypothetical protein